MEMCVLFFLSFPHASEDIRRIRAALTLFFVWFFPLVVFYSPEYGSHTGAPDAVPQ